MKHGIRNICTVLCLGSLMMACSSGGTRPEAVTTLPGCTPGYDASIPLPFPVRKNSIGMEFIEIPAGTFQMGSFEKEKSRHDEIPKHCVTISRPFYLGKYEVTQEQWVAIMEDNPSLYKNPAYPVANVSWEDVQVFISRLNKKKERANIGCQRKRNGNTPLAPEQRQCFLSVAKVWSGNMPACPISTKMTASPVLPARKNRIHGGSMTYTAMSGNGYRTGMTPGITQPARKLTREALRQGRSVCYAGVAGLVCSARYVQPIAATTRPLTGIIAQDSGWRLLPDN